MDILLAGLPVLAALIVAAAVVYGLAAGWLRP